MADFVDNLDAEVIAEQLIPEFHQHLVGLKVAHLLKMGAAKKRKAKQPREGKKVTMAKASKVSDKMRAVGANAHFVIEYDALIWDELDDTQRHALVDHELCFPNGTVVVGPETQAAITRRYSGELVHIGTASGYLLSGTPNHPILTKRGWVELGGINESDYVLCSQFPERVAKCMYPDKYQVESFIENVAGSVDVPFRFMPESAKKLNTNIADGYINVVPSYSHLLTDIGDPTGPQHVCQIYLACGNGIQIPLAGFGELFHSIVSMPLSSPRLHSLLNIFFKVLPFIGSGKPNLLGDRVVTDFDTVLSENSVKHVSVNAEVLAERIQRSTAGVSFDEIRNINRFAFSGHVHNLQTHENWYSANHIVTHNCHCGNDADGIYLKGHALEEFGVVLEKWGLYLPDRVKFAESIHVAEQVNTQVNAQSDNAREAAGE